MIEDFINLIYPNTCYSCESVLKKGEEVICINCRLNLPKTNYFKDLNNPVNLKFRGKVNVVNAFAYLHFVKKGQIQKLLHLLKYKGKQEIGLFFGKELGLELSKNNFSYDIIAPVPMHKKKQNLRGYNQVDSFAQGISESMGVDWCPNILLKVDNTESQTKKGRFDRFKNTEQVFVFNHHYLNQTQKHILLVDDVVTTGSTLESCTKLLLENNFIVSIATIAHAK